MTESSDENVRLLIRCALQSFDDLPISCFSSWTVLQLKEKLAVDCPLKPVRINFLRILQFLFLKSWKVRFEMAKKKRKTKKKYAGFMLPDLFFSKFQFLLQIY